MAEISNQNAIMPGKSNLYAISDSPHALTGLALAGVSGQQTHTPEELHQLLEYISPHTGIIIITSGLATKSAEIIEEFREKNPLPLVVVIPDDTRATRS